MEKYKVCPACGAHNDPQFLECTACEADLQSVPIVDDRTEQAAKVHNTSKENKGVVIHGPMVRVCDCGAKNPVQARRCSACGDDISMISPVPDTVPDAQQGQLCSLDGAYTYKIAEGCSIIGREHEMKDYLAGKHYVSRRHAELTFDSVSGKLTLRNCNTTNYTFVNNEKISGDMCVELRDGDEIGLGGNEQNGSRQAEAAYFIVRLGACI